MSNRIQFSLQQIEDIIHLYTSENMSISKIADLYNVNDDTIKRRLKENNISIKNNNFYKKKKFNENFFDDINTEEKAYWLGFIYADGCVSNRKTTDVFEIKLSEKDKAHLEKLKAVLNSEHSIGVHISSCGYNVGKKYCSFSIVNQHLVDSLVEKGVLYRKTRILKFPNETQVPRNLIKHFIRGYFDGDGSVYCLEESGIGNISFVGTKNMLEGILNEFKCVIPTTTQIHKYKNKDVYDLKIGGSNYFKKCYNFLYQDATIFLDRKKCKFEDILSKQ
jgi:hypothetical protein